ncbi:MAG: ribbon-helix-helix protein, CopG family [Nanoarchaeota archaeon]|nr:ribbon-helix-helix protein, CopG family [Nanoarchaeota archaeon]
MVKNKLVGIYLENETLKRIIEIAKEQGIDKSAVIKQAIQEFIDNIDDKMNDYYIKDYINLKLTENEVKERFEWKEIPKDIQEARKEVLNKIKQEAKGK